MAEDNPGKWRRIEDAAQEALLHLLEGTRLDVANALARQTEPYDLQL